MATARPSRRLLSVDNRFPIHTHCRNPHALRTPGGIRFGHRHTAVSPWEASRRERRTAPDGKRIQIRPRETVCPAETASPRVSSVVRDTSDLPGKSSLLRPAPACVRSTAATPFPMPHGAARRRHPPGMDGQAVRKGGPRGAGSGSLKQAGTRSRPSSRNRVRRARHTGPYLQLGGSPGTCPAARPPARPRAAERFHERPRAGGRRRCAGAGTGFGTRCSPHSSSDRLSSREREEKCAEGSIQRAGPDGRSPSERLRDRRLPAFAPRGPRTPRSARRAPHPEKRAERPEKGAGLPGDGPEARRGNAFPALFAPRSPPDPGGPLPATDDGPVLRAPPLPARVPFHPGTATTHSPDFLRERKPAS